MSAYPIPTWLCEYTDDRALPIGFSQIKKQHHDIFLKYGMPTQQNERFKYTDFSFLDKLHFSTAMQRDRSDLANYILVKRLRQPSICIVLINGHFAPELSDIDKLPTGVKICSLKEALTLHTNDIFPFDDFLKNNYQYPFAHLNIAMCKDGLFIALQENIQLTTPIHLLCITDNIEKNVIAHPHHRIVMNQNSFCTLIEEHIALTDQSYFMNIFMGTLLAKNAQLTHYKLQQEGKQALHMAHHFIKQKQDSCATLMQFSFGSLFARDDVVIQLQEKGATAQTSGFYHLREKNQYVDYHIEIDHQAPCSTSEMIYKGIVDNKSRAVFNGRLHVQKEAQKIIAHQQNHNLLLSPQAEVYSKPELEIYADDVKCKHGATTGEIDQDALFYLCSRGISKEEAMTILLQGFLQEIIIRITHPPISQRVQEMVIHNE